MSDQNKATIARIFEKIWNQHDLDLIEEIYAENFRAHITHSPEDISGVEAFFQFVALFQAMYPDFTFTVDDQIAEGDKVATRWTARTPELGDEAAMTGISIHRLVDGKVVESWDNWDSVSALQASGPELFDQIGVSL
ncbi:MAG: ester cyclase [Desulfobacterales bacterium]|nr:ester cyclase [Desulfobacterales bacterium]